MHLGAGFMSQHLIIEVVMIWKACEDKLLPDEGEACFLSAKTSPFRISKRGETS